MTILLFGLFLSSLPPLSAGCIPCDNIFESIEEAYYNNLLWGWEKYFRKIFRKAGCKQKNAPDWTEVAEETRLNGKITITDEQISIMVKNTIPKKTCTIDPEEITEALNSFLPRTRPILLDEFNPVHAIALKLRKKLITRFYKIRHEIRTNKFKIVTPANASAKVTTLLQSIAVCAHRVRTPFAIMNWHRPCQYKVIANEMANTKRFEFKVLNERGSIRSFRLHLNNKKLFNSKIHPEPISES